LFLRARDDGSLLAVSVLKGGESALTDHEAHVLLAIPADRWVAAEGAGDAETIGRLANDGLIISDSPDGDLPELRRRDEQLASPAWNRYAALFHSLTRWAGVRAVVAGEAPLPESPGRWPPPPHFHTVSEALSITELPVVESEGPLFEVLGRRKTSRGFDADASLTLVELSTLLRYVWGCHGVLDIRDELTILKKTSPSGGSQHPIEVYPLVRAVEGIDPGLYHYAVEGHELELLEPLRRETAGELIVEFTAGQEHFRNAQAVFLMAARFGRNFWKYSAHAKAYRVVLMDAAHLSQTFFLVCSELGLGAFVSAAINEQDIDRRLRLPVFTEGALLVCGCGRAVLSDREPKYQPYAPPRPQGPPDVHRRAQSSP
jgi:putative peptide maturation dehydrogenase